MAKVQKKESVRIRQQVSSEEWKVRTDLAACYRLVAYFGWNDFIFTHISARVPGPEHTFLINPFGLFFDEITASSLIKIDLDGNILLDESGLGFNIGGYVIHGAVHEAREDAKCVIHLHTNEGVAVSGQENGLLPLNQDSMSLIHDLAYHDYEGIALDTEERTSLIGHLGTKNLMILRNHGLLTVGDSVASAFTRMHSLQKACTMQVMTLASGVPIGFPSEAAKSKVQEQVKSRQRPGNKLPISLLAWRGLLRRLDKTDASYKD